MGIKVETTEERGASLELPWLHLNLSLGKKKGGNDSLSLIKGSNLKFISRKEQLLTK